MGRPVSSGSVAYLDDAEVKPVDVSEPSLTSAKHNAQKVVENITKRKFKPVPGESCGQCDQSQICREKISMVHIEENVREKVKSLLRELFQFNNQDLDFGIYRIMNFKRKRD